MLGVINANSDLTETSKIEHNKINNVFTFIRFRTKGYDQNTPTNVRYDANFEDLNQIVDLRYSDQLTNLYNKDGKRNNTNSVLYNKQFKQSYDE